MVRLGTKWLSITSTCSQSATPETASASLASRAKSADRMLGAIWTAIGPSVDGGPRPAWVTPGVNPGPARGRFGPAPRDRHREGNAAREGPARVARTGKVRHVTPIAETVIARR